MKSVLTRLIMSGFLRRLLADTKQLTGLLSMRQYEALDSETESLDREKEVSAVRYHQVVRYLERSAGWCRATIEDRFNLWEWLDHMLSQSSNAAGSTVWKQAMPIRRFGSAYPPSRAEETAFLKDTPKTELSTTPWRP